MRYQRSIAVLLVLLLVASAGCSGLSTDATETATPAGDVTADSAKVSPTESPQTTESGDDPSEQPTDEPENATEAANRTLSADVYATWERTRAMFDTDADRPTVHVENIDDDLEDAYEQRSDPFQARMNISETVIDTENARGIARGDEVTVDPNDAGPVDVEQTLVHEYFHSIQFYEQWYPQWSGLDSQTATSTDLDNVYLGLLEGGAVWVVDQYSARHQDDDVRLQSERLGHEYETAPDGDRYFRAPYHFGAQYFDERVDDPANVHEVYENPPETTEQLLHGLDPEAEPATDLEVTAETTDRWSTERNDRMGELFVRVALGSELPEPEAADAAAGWGDDRLVRVDGADETGYVWVIEWDTAEDADEFETAFESVLDRRTDDAADETAVDRHDDRTVVIAIGSASFRESVSVSGSGADLAVSIDG